MDDAYNSFDKKKIYRPANIFVPPSIQRGSDAPRMNQQIAEEYSTQSDASYDEEDSEIELEFLNQAMANLHNHRILPEYYEIEQNDTDSVS